MVVLKQRKRGAAPSLAPSPVPSPAPSLAPSLAAKLRSLSLEEAFLLAEALVLVSLAAPAIRLLRFPTLGRMASLRIAKPADDARRSEQVALVTWALDRAGKRAAGRALCFERGLAGQIMLRRRGVASTLYYGVGHEADGRLVSHVWVRDRGVDVAGGETASNYATLAQFPPADPAGQPDHASARS